MGHFETEFLLLITKNNNNYEIVTGKGSEY